jgi:hypothetical protein
MKKILLVCDGIAFPEGAFRFARRLNKVKPILLIGVFMPQVSYAHLWSYTHALGGSAVLPPIDKSDNEIIQKNIRHLKSRCQKVGITCRVHKDYADFALPELQHEIRFGDLLLPSSERFYHDILGNDDIDYIAEALHKIECPTAVVPEQFNFPISNVIAYLFPDQCSHEIRVMYLHKDNEKTLPHEPELKELVQQHFPNAMFLETGAPAKVSLSKWLIAGPFGRSAFSQLFHKSFWRDVIASDKLPVFITHK